MLIKSLHHENQSNIPIWLMRQAGRYLPEYKEIRKKAGGFLDLCYTPNLATEVTLQPIDRFGFDAAILFSDILVIPDALGLDVKFKENIGPIVEQLDTLNSDQLEKHLEILSNSQSKITSHLSPIFQTIKNVRRKLDKDKPLIGFCGAPWTVGLYMTDAKPSKGTENMRRLAYSNPRQFEKLMNILIESSTIYLLEQIKSGVNILQIFDSWAGQVPNNLFEQAIKKPLLQICKNIKDQHPEIPIILFPKGLHLHQLEELVDANKAGKLGEPNKPNECLFEGLNIDYTLDLELACEKLQDKICIQGNMDPAIMLTTPDVVRREATKVLEIATKKPGFIFNFGHGILPTVPIENVEELVKTIREFKSCSH